MLDSADELAHQGALEFEVRSKAAIEKDGRFAVALSGGSTPYVMFELIASPEFSDLIEWGRVHAFWGDERCVPPDDGRSNYGAAQEALLRKVPIPESNVHRMLGELDPHAAAAAYSDELERFFGSVMPRFDLVYLGVGPDGHAASIFPHTGPIDVTDVPCVANHVPRAVPAPWRLTLTYPAFNAAAAVIFLVAGEAKADIVADVLQGPVDPRRLPAQGVRPEHGELIWMLDHPAASKLRL